MGRLDKRIDRNRVPYFRPESNEPVDEETNQYREQQNLQQPDMQRFGRLEEEEEYRRHYSPLRKRKKDFGSSRNAYNMAKDIENNPSPKGAIKMTFCGRPLDLHALEDYLVWHTSPLDIKTILRYGNAKTMEDIRGYTNVLERKGGKSGAMFMIILAVILLVGGIVFLLFGPKLGAMLGM